MVNKVIVAQDKLWEYRWRRKNTTEQNSRL